MSYRLGVGNYNPTTPCGLSGLGCPDCGGTCKGLGLFDSGLDFSGWGMTEWAVVLVGAYAVGSMLFTTSRGVSATRGAVKRTRRRIARRISGSE